MNRDVILQKTIETLAPLETDHILHFLQQLTVKSAITNPWFVAAFLVVGFYAFIVRSKFVLCLLFTAAMLLIIIRYAMPVEGDSLALSSTIPFAFGGFAIGGFIIYLYFIKTE